MGKRLGRATLRRESWSAVPGFRLERPSKFRRGAAGNGVAEPESPNTFDAMASPRIGSVRSSSGIHRRESTSPNATDSTIIDLDAYVVWVSERPVSLRPKERHLLLLLEQSTNRVLRTQDLVLALYGNIAAEAGHNRLRRLVADIRQRLGTTFADRLRTVRGVGFVLIDNAYVGGGGAKPRELTNQESS